VIEAPEEIVSFDVFNVGDTSENYQKKMIVDEVMKLIPDAKIKYISKKTKIRETIV